jgi:glycosyltransferase involved in cell wall biosynthesis
VAILEELGTADAVHVRCPANISLLAILMLTFVKHPRPRWVKYAGNWMPSRSESWSYTVQRWWLRRRLHRGSVTVNGEWTSQPSHVYSFPNPCLSEDELRAGRAAAERKNLAGTILLLFVGRLDEEKGCGRAVRTLALLRSQGLDARLDVIGDGPQSEALQQSAIALGVSDAAVFHGWKSRESLGAFYAKAHFLILPSESSEGWPKVLSEAMAYGAVPIAGAISSIPQVLRHVEAGQSLPPGDVDAFARAVQNYVEDPAKWRRESLNAVGVAPTFSYSSFLRCVMRLFRAEWGIDLSPSR